MENNDMFAVSVSTQRSHICTNNQAKILFTSSLNDLFSVYPS